MLKLPPVPYFSLLNMLMSKNEIKFFLVNRANEQERDQLDVFNRLIEKWTEHDEPIIIQSL